MFKNRFEGLKGFYLLWFGQFISIFASRMTGFAITLWAWDITGSATTLVLVGFTSFIPLAILSPIAGTLVDRWNRKLILVLSDAAAAISTAFLLLMFFTEQIELWHLYVAGAFSGIFGAFQYPAYSAVVTTMVPKKHYARANSMRSLISSASGSAAPLMAGSLIGPLKISGIMIIDLITFFIAILLLFVILIPQPEISAEGAKGKGSVWEETIFGFRYVFKRPSLLAFFLMFTIGNIGAGFGFPMMNPMILAKTGNDAAIMGLTNSASSVGFLAGSLLMGIWGGPKKKIHGVNWAYIGWGLLGTSIFALGWSIPIWLVGAFFLGIFNPIINGNYMAILQAKVSPDLQGRIFGVDMLITTITFPFSQLFAGLLVDNVLEPAMSSQSRLADIFGSIVGIGPGAGLGLMIILGGFVSIATGLIGYLNPNIRNIEEILPDHSSVN